jgi:hypothetical protein
MRLVLATLATLGLLTVFDLVRELVPFPEAGSALDQALSAIIVTASAAVGGYIGGRWFVPIAACIALGSFALVTHIHVLIAAPVEPTSFTAMLMEIRPWAVVPFGAAVLGAWGGHEFSARKSRHAGNEI